jgi:hypothetical protein
MAEDQTLPDAAGGGDAPVETTLHDDISQAVEQIETRDAPPAPGAPAKTPPAGGDPAAAPAPGERARGPDGRFAPAADAPAKAPAKAPAAPAAPGLAQPPKPAPAIGQQPQAQPAAPALRAPASWKPAAREHWAKLPPDVQQEVVRREVETARTLQESSRAREALSYVQQAIGPFAQNIHASGTDAISMIGNLMKADNTLRHGSISDKASLVADIIKNYGVDITALDRVLAGAQPSADPSAMLADQLRRDMDARLQPVMQFFQTMHGARQQRVEQINTEAATEVEAFAADPAHEFYEDVRAEMADIIDLYTQRGASISLQDAYDRAIKLNPQVSEIVTARAEQERASAAASAAQRARRTAAGSISSAPAPAGVAPGPAGDDRRSSIEAAWDSASSG